MRGWRLSSIPGRFSLSGDPARIVSGSYQAAAGLAAPILGDAERTGFLDFLFAGLVTGDRYSPTVGLMAFILVLGGVFGMIMRTRAIDAALIASLPDGRARDERLVIAMFVAFSLGGAVFGMSEEAIALTLVLTPALSRAGYDAITSVLVCYGATQIGFATSWMNPFSVVIAQSISGLPPMSGMGVRIGIWSFFTLVGALFVWRHSRAARLAGAVTASARHADDDAEQVQAFSAAHVIILAAVLAGIAWVAWGVVMQGLLPCRDSSTVLRGWSCRSGRCATFETTLLFARRACDRVSRRCRSALAGGIGCCRCQGHNTAARRG